MGHTIKLTKLSETDLNMFKEIRSKLPENSKEYRIFDAQIKRVEMLKDGKSNRDVSQDIAKKYNFQTSTITNFFQKTGRGMKLIKQFENGTLDTFIHTSVKKENNEQKEKCLCNNEDWLKFIENIKKWEDKEDWNKMREAAIKIKTDKAFVINKESVINEQELSEL